MTSLVKYAPATVQPLEPNNKEACLNVEIDNGKFRLYLTEETPQDKNRALTTLKKIEAVFAGVEAGKLQFEPTHDFSGFLEKDALDFLEAQSSKIKRRSEAMPNSIASVVSFTSKKIENTSKTIDRAVSRRHGAKLTSIPKPIVTEVGSYLDARDIAALRHVNHELSGKASQSILERAKKFGYRGSNIEEAKSYLASLFSHQVGAVIGYNVALQEQVSLRGGNESTLIKLSKMQITGQQVINICSSAKNQAVNSYFLSYLENRQTNPTILEQFQRRSLDEARLLGYAEQGNTNMVKLLLKLGVNPNSARCSKGHSALHKAVMGGHLETVEALLNAKADIHARDSEGRTPFHHAVQCGNMEMAKLLFKAGADINSPTSIGHTPLHVASERGLLEMAKLLLTEGADIHARDRLGNTPLHHAIYCGHLEFAKFLLDQGADINARNSNGVTPFLLSSTEEAASLLIDRGAKTDVTTIREKYTLLHDVLLKNVRPPDSFVQLLTKHIDVNAKDHKGNTALHMAQNIETFQILRQAGASLDALNTDGWNPLHAAVYRSIPYLEFLLKQYDVNAVDKHGRTALHYACARSNKEIIKCLLQAGANINIKDESGKTPISYAVSRGDKSILNLF